MKFSIKNFFSKCDQIRSFLRILSHWLKNGKLNFLCRELHRTGTPLRGNLNHSSSYIFIIIIIIIIMIIIIVVIINAHVSNLHLYLKMNPWLVI